MKQHLRFVAVLAACAALALQAGACAGKKRGGPPPRPPVSVRTSQAVKIDAPVVIRAFGNTEDRESVDIVPQVSGILLKTYIEEGAVVTNGQPLFLVDPSDYAARVRQAEGMVAADRANLDLSRITLERNRSLHEKGLISREDFDTLKTRADAVQAQLQIDEAGLDQARLNLSRCTIAAPLAGICSKRYVDDGNLAAAGQTRLTNIRSYDPIDLEFSVSEQYLPVIRRAMAEGPVRIEITPRGDTNSFAGVLRFLDNAVSLQTGTILLRGQAPNRELKLWARQFVDVRMFAGSVRDAVMVPEGAVQFGKSGPYLFAVSADGKADMRLVKTGVRYNDLIQIMEGVSAGERVVVLGQLMLSPGAQVAEAAGGPAGAGEK